MVIGASQKAGPAKLTEAERGVVQRSCPAAPARAAETGQVRTCGSGSHEVSGWCPATPISPVTAAEQQASNGDQRSVANQKYFLTGH